jgi:hypothetical protein
MKLDPTSTCDQNDNERPTRHLECQPGSKEGFVNMIMRWIKKGSSVCHVVFIFQHSTPIGLMKRTLNNVYRAILTRYDRDPRKSEARAEGN